MAKLEIVNGKNAGQVVEIPAGEDLEIGTKRKAFLRLRDPGVSYGHATVCLKGDKLSLQDKKSGSGTFVDDKKLALGPVELTNGQSFKLGDIEIRFVADAEADTPASPEPEEKPSAAASATDDGLQAALEEAEQANKSLSSERDKLRKELESTNARLIEAEEIASNDIEQVSTLEVRNGKLENRIQELESQASGIEEKLRDTYEGRVKELAEEAKNARNDAIKLKKDMANLLNTQTQLEERLANSNAGAAQLQEQLEQNKSAADKRVKKYEKDLSEARKIAKAARSRGLSKNQIPESFELIKGSSDEEDIQSGLLALFEGNGSSAELPANDDSVTLAQIHEQVADSAAALENLKNSGAQIPVSIEELKEQLQNRDNEFQAVKEDLEAKRREVEELNQDFQATMDELEALKD
jgi:pSer/pThr/pTyr-binding forkhead associated (FHA) protein